MLVSAFPFVVFSLHAATKARLGFLVFALTNSSGLSLAEAHVDLVWRVLVEGALTPEAAGKLQGANGWCVGFCLVPARFFSEKRR